MKTGNLFQLLLALARRKWGEGNHSHNYGRRKVEGGLPGCSGYGVFCPAFFIPHHPSRGARACLHGDRILAFFCSMVFFSFSSGFSVAVAADVRYQIPRIVGLPVSWGETPMELAALNFVNLMTARLCRHWYSLLHYERMRAIIVNSPPSRLVTLTGPTSVYSPSSTHPNHPRCRPHPYHHPHCRHPQRRPYRCCRA
jgi:hypothetical protein